MKKELTYFNIEDSYGGNQKWFKNLIMKFGGCAAITACDLCIYLSIIKEVKDLYPFDLNSLSKDEYIRFSHTMKSYLHPRIGGINTLDLYIDGLGKYFYTNNYKDINITPFYKENNIIDSKNIIISQINNETPIPFLLLRHKNRNFKEFVWHWFLIVGYKEVDEKFFVKTVTYGKYKWILFEDLWNSGYEENGGMIIIDLKE